MEGEQKIFFGSKEDNNRRRDEEAINRTSHERFIFFLKLCEEMEFFGSSGAHPNDKKNNFIIE
jgi:hypothetical protein